MFILACIGLWLCIGFIYQIVGALIFGKSVLGLNIEGAKLTNPNVERDLQNIKEEVDTHEKMGYYKNHKFRRFIDKHYGQMLMALSIMLNAIFWPINLIFAILYYSGFIKF